MSNNRSVLRFEKYIVKKVAFDANEEFLNKEKEVDLDFDFDTKSNVDGNTMEIELSVNIFDDAVVNMSFVDKLSFEAYGIPDKTLSVISNSFTSFKIVTKLFNSS